MRERRDEALMQAFADGSMEAFECLYERHRSGLYRYVVRKTGYTAEANDLFQGAWEKVIRARAQYQPRVPFRAWLYRITYNHVMDYFRRVEPTTEMLFKQKDVFLLKLEGGLDIGEIASVTGVNRETAKSRLRYATGKLKAMLMEGPTDHSNDF